MVEEANEQGLLLRQSLVRRLFHRDQSRRSVEDIDAYQTRETMH